MTELLRQHSCSYKRIVAIVDHDLLESMEEAWIDLPKDIRSISSMIKVAQNQNGLNRKKTKSMSDYL